MWKLNGLHNPEFSGSIYLEEICWRNKKTTFWVASPALMVVRGASETKLQFWASLPGKTVRKRLSRLCLQGILEAFPSLLFSFCALSQTQILNHTLEVAVRYTPTSSQSRAGEGLTASPLHHRGSNLQAAAAGKSAWSHPGQVCQDAGACKYVALRYTDRSKKGRKANYPRCFKLIWIWLWSTAYLVTFKYFPYSCTFPSSTTQWNHFFPSDPSCTRRRT